MLDRALRKVERYHFDFVFKGDAGLKAVVEIYETQGGLYGNHKIIATVQVNGADEDALRRRIGQDVQFQGRLVKVDGFMHNIYVADGTIAN